MSVINHPVSVGLMIFGILVLRVLRPVLRRDMG